ncbi:MAG: hemerythrin domain-containing protein [Ginsengibacter sp.]
METKPLKRHDDIVKLSKDHHAGLLFCWKIRQGVKFHVEKNRMIRYVKYYWDHHFSTHFHEEEAFLFAPVKNDEVQKAIEDHQKIKIFIDKIGVSGVEKKEDDLLELADTVDNHIRFEERILFPHLQKTLSEAQLQKIGEQIDDAPFVENYEDQFWIKSPSL